MTHDQLRCIRPGDRVQHTSSRETYIITGAYGGRCTGVRTIDITNPVEWDLLQSGSPAHPEDGLLAFLKREEGFRRDAYLDPSGTPTIGYGTTEYPGGAKVALGETITEMEADVFLAFQCHKLRREITTLTLVPLKPHQLDALVSFCYNVGLGAFTRSTLRKKLNQGDFPGAAKEFLRWNKATINGVKRTLPGLTARRQREKALFEGGDLT